MGWGGGRGAVDSFIWPWPTDTIKVNRGVGKQTKKIIHNWEKYNLFGYPSYFIQYYGFLFVRLDHGNNKTEKYFILWKVNVASEMVLGYLVSKLNSLGRF